MSIFQYSESSEAFPLILNPDWAPHLSRTSDICKVVVQNVWSPRGVIHYGRCLLACLTNMGQLSLFGTDHAGWVEKVDLSLIWLRYCRPQWSDPSTNTKYLISELQYRTSRIKYTAVAWERFGLGDEFACSSLLITASMDGIIGLWIVEDEKHSSDIYFKSITSTTESGITVKLMRVFDSKLTNITSLLWCRVDETSGLLVAGNVKGAINSIRVNFCDTSKTSEVPTADNQGHICETQNVAEEQPNPTSETETNLTFELLPNLKSATKTDVMETQFNRTSEKQSNLTSETETHLMETQCNITSETQPNETSEPQPNIPSETQSNITTETQPNITSGMQPNLTSATKANLTTETQCKINSETQPDVTPEPQPNITYETQLNITSAMQPNLISDIQPNITYEMQPNLVSDTQPNITYETNPNLTSETQPNPISETQPSLIPELQSNLSSRTQPNFISKRDEVYLFNSIDITVELLWPDEDLLSVSSLMCWDDDNNNVCAVCVKGTHIIVLILRKSDGKLISKHCHNTKRRNLTGLIKLNNAAFLISSQKGAIFKLTLIQEEDGQVTFLNETVQTNFIKNRFGVMGLATSQNRALIAVNVSVIGPYDSTRLHRPTSFVICAFENTEIDPVAIVGSKNFINLDRVWDCLELARLNILQKSIIYIVPTGIREQLDTMDINPLIITMWLIHFVTYSLQLEQMEEPVDDSSVQSKFISMSKLFDEIQVLVFSSQIFQRCTNLLANDKPNNFDLRSLSLMRKWIIWLDSIDNIHATTKLTASSILEQINMREFELINLSDNEICVMCGGNVPTLTDFRVSECVQGHRLPRCSLSLVQIPSECVYLHCQRCGAMAHPLAVAGDFALCVFCKDQLIVDENQIPEDDIAKLVEE